MSLSYEETMEILKNTGALKEGHFRLTSGLHSDHYVQCSQLLKFPKLAEKVCSALAEKFADNKPDVVVGPATVVFWWRMKQHGLWMCQRCSRNVRMAL